MFGDQTAGVRQCVLPLEGQVKWSDNGSWAVSWEGTNMPNCRQMLAVEWFLCSTVSVLLQITAKAAVIFVTLQYNVTIPATGRCLQQGSGQAVSGLRASEFAS